MTGIPYCGFVMSDQLSVAEIDQQLKDLVHWERLALHLEDIVYADIEIIKKEHPLMVANQRLALFGKWLNKCTKPTWNKLALALEKVDENKLAQQIRREYLTPGNGHQQEGKAADGQGTIQQPAIPVDQEVVTKLVKLHESFVNIAANFKKELKSLVKTDAVELEDVITLTKEARPTFTLDETIDDVADINLFFRIIFPHYHFLNCHLLVMLAKRFLNPSGVLDDLIQHQMSVLAFKRSIKVTELKQVLESFVTKLPHETPVTVKVQDAWDEIKLNVVEILLQTMFRLPHSDVLKIFRVVPGSVIIVYLVPHHITESLITHSQHNTEFMRLTGIISLQVGETYVLREDSNEEGDHEEYSFEIALMEAIGMGNREAVTFLLEHVHVDINLQIQSVSSIKILEQKLVLSPNSLSGIGTVTPLLIAYCCTNTDMVQLLLDSKADPDITIGNTGETLLYIACLDDHLEAVKQLILANASLNISGIDGATPLFAASDRGHLEIVSCLLQAKADPDISMIDGATPLYVASQNNQIGVVEHLLEAKANPDTPRNDGSTPLYVACGMGYIEVVEKLLRANGDPNISLPVNGATPILMASQNGHVKVVEMLIRAKAKPDTPMDDGATALFVASQNGHPEIVELLLQMANANPNSPRKDGITPLYIASQLGFTAIVQKLLQAKAIVDIPSSDDGATPLHIASLNGHLAVVDLLLSANANAEFPMDNGATPLYIASENGHIEVVKRLLQSKANPNTPASDGTTPIYIASLKGHLKVVEALLEANAIADIPNDNGLTPLFVASQEGHFKIVQKLLQAKANPEVSNLLGETPLFIACKSGHVEVIKKLLQANADLNSPSLEGVTPLMIANDHGQSKVAELIEHHIISSFKH